MPINKNAFLRYLTLDKCFNNPGRMYFIDDLLEECNNSLMNYNSESSRIERRQLFYDIKFMESEEGWSIPLARHKYGRKTFYRYSDLSFSINNQPLNKTEAEYIKSALVILSRFSGSPQFQWVHEIIPMFEDKFDLMNNNEEVISFESNIDLKGLHFLSPLFNAINNKRVLKILYKDFKSSYSYEIIFHPLYLKQYNNRWFAFGLNEEKEDPYWNMAIDRIEEIRETDFAYTKIKIDWEEYFYDIIGVTRNAEDKPQEILLEFSNQIAPYIITKPIHPSQKHTQTPHGLEVKINVIPNYELVSLLLSFGEKVRVKQPQNIQETIISRSRNNLENYNL